MFKHNSTLKIISLIAAICLWLYVTGEVDPEMKAKVSNIPVSLANTEMLTDYGLAAAYDEPISISATISGKRSDVNDVKKNGLTAYVDVADCDLGTNEEKIVINTPDGISVENSSQTTLKFEVEYIVQAVKPVVIEFTEETVVEEDSAEQKIPWVMDQYPQEVTVWGAASSVKKVEKIKGTVDPTAASADKRKTLEAELEPVNGKGNPVYGIMIDMETAEAEVQLLSSKTVELVLTGDEGENIDVDSISAPETVIIAGGKSALSKIDSVEGTVTKDEKGRINISVDLPENIYLPIGEDNGKIIWN